MLDDYINPKSEIDFMDSLLQNNNQKESTNDIN